MPVIERFLMIQNLQKDYFKLHRIAIPSMVKVALITLILGMIRMDLQIKNHHKLVILIKKFNSLNSTTTIIITKKRMM